MVSLTVPSSSFIGVYTALFHASSEQTISICNMLPLSCPPLWRLIIRAFLCDGVRFSVMVCFLLYLLSYFVATSVCLCVQVLSGLST